MQRKRAKDLVRTAIRLEVEANAEPAELIPYFSEAIRIQPDFKAAYYYRAHAYKRQERLDKAMADVTRFIELDQNNAKAYSLRAAIFIDQHKHAEAIGDLTKSIALNPNNAKAYHQRGYEYWILRIDNREAIADFTQAIALNPNFIDAYVHRAIMYTCDGEADKAIADYMRIIEIDPTHIFALGELIELIPNDSMLYFKRGKALYHQRRFAEAEADFHRVTELNPEFANAYYCRGLCSYQQRDFPNAIHDMKKAIKLNPDYDVAISSLLQLTPNDADAYYKRGVMYLRQEKFAESISDFTTAIRLNAHRGAYFDRGDVFNMQGKLAEAIADFSQYIDLTKSATNLAIAKTELKTILLNIKPDDDLSAISKADLDAAIGKLDDETQIELYKRCLDPGTGLGNRFWTRSSFTFRACSLDSDELKDICDHLKALDPTFVPLTTRVFESQKTFKFPFHFNPNRTANLETTYDPKKDEFKHGKGL